MNDGVTVIMPAYNEEKNIRRATMDAEKVLRSLSCQYEIILVDDGSTDKTGKIAQQLAKEHDTVRVLHNSINRGLGYCLRRALSIATMSYVTLYPSDNEMEAASFKHIVSLRTKADLILAYMENPTARSMSRRILSALFVAFVNRIFNLRLRYYTGPFIAKTASLSAVPLTSNGVTILAELRVRLLARRATYLEIPFVFTMRKYGRATLFRWKTFAQTLDTIFVLLWDKLFGNLTTSYRP